MRLALAEILVPVLFAGSATARTARVVDTEILTYRDRELTLRGALRRS